MVPEIFALEKSGKWNVETFRTLSSNFLAKILMMFLSRDQRARRCPRNEFLEEGKYKMAEKWEGENQYVAVCHMREYRIIFFAQNLTRSILLLFFPPESEKKTTRETASKTKKIAVEASWWGGRVPEERIESWNWDRDRFRKRIPKMSYTVNTFHIVYHNW